MLSTSYGFLQTASPLDQASVSTGPKAALTIPKASSAQQLPPTTKQTSTSTSFPLFSHSMSKSSSSMSTATTSSKHSASGILSHTSAPRQLLKKMSSVSRLKSRPMPPPHQGQGSVGTNSSSTLSTTPSAPASPTRPTTATTTMVHAAHNRPPSPIPRRRSGSSDLWGSPLDAEAVAMGLVAPQPLLDSLPLTPRTPLPMLTAHHASKPQTDTTPSTSKMPFRRLLKPPAGFRRHYQPQHLDAHSSSSSSSQQQGTIHMASTSSSPGSLIPRPRYPGLWSQADEGHSLQIHINSSPQGPPSGPAVSQDHTRDRPSSSPSESSSLFVHGKEHFAHSPLLLKGRSQSVPRDEQKYDARMRGQAAFPLEPAIELDHCPYAHADVQCDYRRQSPFHSSPRSSNRKSYDGASPSISTRQRRLSQHDAFDQLFASPTSSRTWLAAQDLTFSSPATIRPYASPADHSLANQGMRLRGQRLPPPSAPPSGPLPALPSPPQPIPSSATLPPGPLAPTGGGHRQSNEAETGTRSLPSSPLDLHKTGRSHIDKKMPTQSRAPSAWVERDLNAQQKAVAFASDGSPPRRDEVVADGLPRTPGTSSMSYKSIKMSPTRSASHAPSPVSISSQSMKRSASVPEPGLCFVETVKDVFFDGAQLLDEDSEECQTPTSGSFASVLVSTTFQCSPTPSGGSGGQVASLSVPLRMASLTTLRSGPLPCDAKEASVTEATAHSSPSSSLLESGHMSTSTSTSPSSQGKLKVPECPATPLSSSLRACAPVMSGRCEGRRECGVQHDKPMTGITFGDEVMESKEKETSKLRLAQANSQSRPVNAEGRALMGTKKESLQECESAEAFMGRGRSVSHTWDPETEQIVMNYLSLSSRNRSGSSGAASTP